MALSKDTPGKFVAGMQAECVWNNSATRLYELSATGSGNDGSFRLGDGTPYDVQWSTSNTIQTTHRLTPGTPLTGLTSSATGPTCGSDPATEAYLVVAIAAANSRVSPGPTPGGHLTMLVSPE